MKNYVGVAVSIGVLAGIWTQVSSSLELVTWVGFLAWACYFAAGGGRVGFTRGRHSGTVVVNACKVSLIPHPSSTSVRR